MRRLIGPLAFGLAGFLLCAAVLLLTWAPGQLKRTPTDIKSETRLSGMGNVLPTGDAAPVKAISYTKADGEKSDSDVVVFDTFTCLIKDPDGTAPDCVDAQDPQRRLVNASTDRFATDRRVATSVNETKYTGNSPAHEGVVNKLPFDVEKKTYPYWDGLLGRAVDLTYEGTERVSGLETYKFRAVSQDEPAEIAKGIQGTYSSDKTIWVDPVTGSFINQREKQVRKTDTGQTVLDLDFGFTDETVAKNVKDAKANGSRLGMLGTLPWILGALGLVSLAVGIVAWMAGRGETVPARRRETYDSTDDIFGDPDDLAADTTTRSRSDLHRR
ncbi:Protein of unknown function (DUF3068) [Knoellia remsis]|uniref:DUF3068 family protein n=1 Tax=Knoellia remsis TaxID=407159 RepID=A0A2T0UUC3_9MICO|nr:DUF3068 domain-containing protein [Knoellia remsis]PRY61532.1 Protein of unknown function (DUF3068) [Knoellia remsis]